MGALVSVNTAETETWHAFAEQFLASNRPQAVVHIPFGCLTGFLNKAAVAAAPVAAKELARRKVFDGTPREFVELLDQMNRRLARDRKPDVNDVCFCEIIGAIDVLRIGDCELFRMHQSGTPSLIRRGLDPVTPYANGNRKYGVLSLAGRKLDDNFLAVTTGVTDTSLIVEDDGSTIAWRTGNLKAGFAGTSFTKVPVGLLTKVDVYVDFFEALVDLENLVLRCGVPAALDRLKTLEDLYPVDEYTVRNVVLHLREQIQELTSSESAAHEIRKRQRLVFDDMAAKSVIFERHGITPSGEPPWTKHALEVVESIDVPFEFDVVYNPNRYFNGIGTLDEETALDVLDLLIGLGTITPYSIQTLSEEETAALTKLTRDGLVHCHEGVYALSELGREALRLRNIDIEKQASASRRDELSRIRNGLRPVREYQGEVLNEYRKRTQGIRFNLGESEEILYFPVLRLKTIDRTEPGSKVIYRFFETPQFALSVIDPA